MSVHEFLYQCMENFISLCPSNTFFSQWRWRFYRRHLIEGSGIFSSLTGLSIQDPKNVFIGDNVSINRFVIIDASEGGRIIIGKNCLIGPYVLMRSADHNFSDPNIPIRNQGHSKGEIIIEEDCWIGGHVTITRNVRIGKGSIIGANSVVTRDIPPYSVAAGTPARVLKTRKD